MMWWSGLVLALSLARAHVGVVLGSVSLNTHAGWTRTEHGGRARVRGSRRRRGVRLIALRTCRASLQLVEDAPVDGA